MFIRQKDNLANGIRLLAAMSGFVSAPSPKSGLAVYDAIRKIAARPPKSLVTMADELTEAARTALARALDAPKDADILFVQMVEAGLLTPQEITANSMDAEACTTAMLAKLSDKTDPTGEMRRPEMCKLFTGIVQSTLVPLFRTKAYAADLTPAYMAESLQSAHRAEHKIDHVAAKLDNLEAQTRDTLDALALRFGEPAPEEMTSANLRAFLIEKAHDYRALQQEVETLRGTTPRIDNVLSAVEASIATLDLEEAERLLVSVRETSSDALRKPLEDNARVMEAQARIAMMRQRPERAFTLFSSAADSFAALDPLEPSRRRLSYARAFYEYGERFGGPVTEFAERVAHAILAAVDTSNPKIFAEAQNLLGLSLLSQGRYATDASGSDILNRAIEAFTITANTPDGHLRAASLDHLSMTRMTQAHRAKPSDRVDLLRAAITGSREAIELFGDDQPSVARALNNLGNAHLLLADQLDGAELVETLDQAFSALDRATRLFGDLGDIINMAGARFGVATVIERQAKVYGDPARRKRAIDEFDKARQFYREQKMPQDAAMASGAMGSALLTHATNAPPEHIVSLLTAAESALGDAAAHYRDTEQPLLEVALLRKLSISKEMRALALPAPEALDLLHQAQAHLKRAVELGAAGREVDLLHAAQERIENKLAGLAQ
ncbi:hypothetical protein [Roseovarius aestuarii]|uniref:Tetratricopeptide repeat protein n=1 Tax=Roseovarius aestuarii TaxID=475083 RepID=A0A1X7BT71_9RHOB|nr:hypothetical protein [Roseovarius aestuarii]SMC12812.1 hypothetical protein ROA7745_02644 [Roseovarius aestuarii]